MKIVAMWDVSLPWKLKYADCEYHSLHKDDQKCDRLAPVILENIHLCSYRACALSDLY